MSEQGETQEDPVDAQLPSERIKQDEETNEGGEEESDDDSGR